MPRMPSIAGVRRGIEADIKVIGVAESGADTSRTGLAGSPTQVVRTYTPERNSEAVVIPGDAAEAAAGIAKIIAEVL